MCNAQSISAADTQVMINKSITSVMNGRNEMMNFIIDQKESTYNNAKSDLQTAEKSLDRVKKEGTFENEEGYSKSFVAEIFDDLKSDIKKYDDGFKEKIIHEKAITRKTAVMHDGKEVKLSNYSSTYYQDLVEENVELMVSAKK